MKVSTGVARLIRIGVQLRGSLARVGRGSHPIALLLALLGVVAAYSPAVAEDYRLGPGDKIRLKAYEWRASRDEVIEWKSVNDEFTVGANGLVSIPFAGNVQASNRTPGELAKIVSEHLQIGLGLGRAPNTSIEITTYRPFYMVGQVDRPGEYPYRPGLTVLQSLGIAGGIQRLTEQNSLRFSREAIATRGELELLTVQANGFLARKARAEAELSQTDKVSFPQQLLREQTNPVVALIMQQEQLILDARRNAFETQMRALDQLKEYLHKEIASLEGQLQTEDKQIKLVQKELQSVISLVERGLSVAPRQLSLERTLAQIEGDRLRVGTALLKARQEISKTDISIIEVQNKRTNEATTLLRETQSKLDEMSKRFDTVEQLLHDSEVAAPQLQRLGDGPKIRPIFTIVRQRDGKFLELPVDEHAKVEPGDTIKVAVPSLMERNPFSVGSGSAPARIQ